MRCKRRMRDLIDREVWGNEYWIKYTMLRRTLAITPPVQPTQKKGKWVDEVYWGSVGDEYHIWMCSQCKIPNPENTPYCPHCGAKMEEEK